jgi:hypothetical protein
MRHQVSSGGIHPVSDSESEPLEEPLEGLARPEIMSYRTDREHAGSGPSRASFHRCGRLKHTTATGCRLSGRPDPTSPEGRAGTPVAAAIVAAIKVATKEPVSPAVRTVRRELVRSAV